MDLITILTIIALILNFIALGIVAYQTHLNHKALLLTRESIEEDRKARQIEMLPRANFVLETRYLLKKWSEDLEKNRKNIHKAHSGKNGDLLREISQKAISSPSGLVQKSFYENAPQWLTEILMAGAQYYYDCQAPMNDFWIEREQKAFWELAPDLMKRLDESRDRIIELLGYIDQVVPEAYAQAPARLSDHDFVG